MKKIINFIAGFAAVAALFACSSQYEDNKTWSFVVIDANEIEIPEGPYVAGADTTIFIPVWLHNCKSGSTVSYTVTDNTATVGTDYTLVDNSGVLNFDAGVDSLAIELKITGQTGTFTGNVDFSIALVSATNDVVIASTDKCKVTIKDLDHPLSALFGEYKMHQVNISSSSYIYTEYPITISAYEGDATKVWIQDIIYLTYTYGAYFKNPCKVYANVSSEMSKIEIPVPQTTETYSGDLFNGMEEDDFLTLYAITGTDPDALEWTTDKEGVITFTKQEDGSYKTEDSFALNVPSVVKKPDWMYYYMFAFSSFNSAAPTYFSK